MSTAGPYINIFGHFYYREFSNKFYLLFAVVLGTLEVNLNKVNGEWVIV